MTPFEQHQARPMTLDRIDKMLVIGDCIAVCMRDEWLRRWYQGGMDLVGKLMNESEGLEQHAPEAENDLRSRRHYYVPTEIPGVLG